MSAKTRGSLPPAGSGKGVIFDITRYMVEDGPGIRTVVFLQGCPLRCQWCSNALGQEVGAKLVYARRKCIGCGTCVAKCPNGAVSLTADGKVRTDRARCQLCGTCVLECPSKARDIVGRVYSVEDVIRVIEEDRPFYRRGDGGVTLSGGEILLQADFAAHILRECQNRAIHTAIESSAHGSWQALERVLEYADLAFLDVKHMDTQAHRRITGVPNEAILRNVRRAAEYCQARRTALVIRIPVIPSLNDAEDNLRATAEFVKSLSGNVEINLLPYHRLGVNKYDMIDKEYLLADLQPPSAADMERHRKIIEEVGVLCSVGGAAVKTAA